MSVRVFICLGSNGAVVFKGTSFCRSFRYGVISSVPGAVIPNVVIPLSGNCCLTTLLGCQGSLFHVTSAGFLIGPKRDVRRFISGSRSQRVIFLRFLPRPFLLPNQSGHFHPVRVAKVVVKAVLITVAIRRSGLSLIPCRKVVEFSFHAPMVTHVYRGFEF